MNNIEELREHCEEIMAVSPLRYAYIPASSIITLIERIEKAEAELSDWRSVTEAAAQDDADWHKLVDSKNDVISHLASGIINLKDQFEAAQRDRDLHYQVSEKFRIELIATEAELSAANEKLGKPVVLSSSTVMSRVCAVRAIKTAGFTVEGNADAE